MKQNFLPILLDISLSKILIIGGGESALKKIRILQRFNANLEVLAPEVIDEIKEIGIPVFQRDYEKAVLSNYLLVYSCTDDLLLDQQIAEDCKKAGVLFNIHDRPELCQFVSPAIYKKGNLTISVGSNGEDVFQSIRIRDLIKEKLNLN